MTKLIEWASRNPAEVIQAFANSGLLSTLADGQTMAEVIWFKEGPFKSDGRIKGIIKQIFFNGPFLFIEFQEQGIEGDLKGLPKKSTAAATYKLDAYMVNMYLHFKYHDADGSERRFQINSPRGAILTIYKKG